MKYTIKPTTKFQKDLKRIQKRGYDISLLTAILKKLANGETLPVKSRDHNFKFFPHSSDFFVTRSFFMYCFSYS